METALRTSTFQTPILSVYLHRCVAHRYAWLRFPCLVFLALRWCLRQATCYSTNPGSITDKQTWTFKFDNKNSYIGYQWRIVSGKCYSPQIYEVLFPDAACPTPAPTGAPSFPPTREPTGVPTDSPSPTSLPTPTPTYTGCALSLGTGVQVWLSV